MRVSKNARLTGQTAGAVLLTLLFTLAPLGTAPRLGLGIGGALALLAGLISLWGTWDGHPQPAMPC